jgi:hypothetical protein
VGEGLGSPLISICTVGIRGELICFYPLGYQQRGLAV